MDIDGSSTGTVSLDTIWSRTFGLTSFRSYVSGFDSDRGAMSASTGSARSRISLGALARHSRSTPAPCLSPAPLGSSSSSLLVDFEVSRRTGLGSLTDELLFNTTLLHRLHSKVDVRAYFPRCSLTRRDLRWRRDHTDRVHSTSNGSTGSRCSKMVLARR